MEQYTVTGMSCAACSSRVEKAVSAVPGVTSCSVSLLTGSMGVEGTASADAIVAAVRDAGYGAEPKRRGAESAASGASAAAGGLVSISWLAVSKNSFASMARTCFTGTKSLAGS